jgi:hypothetical protein
VEFGDDEPMRLAEACEKLLKGRLTVSGLRREARRGTLEITRIANKDFVTPAAIREMLDRCRVNARPPLSSSRPSAPAPATGASATEIARSRQDALNLTLKALTEH